MALSKIVENSLADSAVSSAKLKDFAAAVDLNGVELVLDADADTSITADTDDRIDFKIANVEHFSFSNSSGDTIIKPMVDAKDIKFQQFDGRTLLDINDAGFVGIENGATGPGAIRIFEDSDLGSNYVGLSVGNVSTSYTLVFPNADGSSGQVMTTNGSGVLSFADSSSNTPSSADGQALGSASLEWSDLFLADASTIQFGNDQDVVLTHVADTGLLLSGTNVIQFNDASQNIGAPSATVLDINATDEIELNATLVDVNANLDVSGTYTGGGLMTTGGNIVIPDAGNIGSASDTDAIAIASNGVTTFSQAPVLSGASISAGTIPATALDIDGATDIGADIVDADLFLIDDGAGGTNRKTAASRIKSYVGSGIYNLVSSTTIGTEGATFTMDNVFTDTYDKYVVFGENFRTGSSQSIVKVRLRTGGGSGSNAGNNLGGTYQGLRAAGGSLVDLQDEVVNSGDAPIGPNIYPDTEFHFMFNVFYPTTTSINTTLQGKTTFREGSSSYSAFVDFGYLSISTEDHTGFSITSSNGNFNTTAVRLTVYGLTNPY